MKRSVMALFRPLRRDIALIVVDGAEHQTVPLSVDEAEAIHGALGQALMLAKCLDDPVKAVPN